MSRVFEAGKALLAIAHPGEPLRRFFGAYPRLPEVFENLAPFFPRDLAHLSWPQAIVACRIAKGAEEIIETGDDGAVGNTEFGFYILDDAPVADEGIEKGHLFSRQAGIPPEQEMPFNGGAAGWALETGDRQLICADRTPAKDIR